MEATGAEGSFRPPAPRNRAARSSKICRVKTWRARAPLSLLLGLGLLLGLASRAGAVDPFEIQVYEGDINHAGQFGLELHSNYTAAGRSSADFSGEAVPQGLLRLTLEPSLALTSWWELGAYLQTATAVGDPAAHWAGFKLRSKFIAPTARTTPFVLGLNFEIGRGVAVLGTADWDIEVRPIIAWFRGRWGLAVNPIVGWAVTGPRHAAPDLEPAVKVRVDLGQRVAAGVEYYAELGVLSAPKAWHDQEHYLYAVADVRGLPFDLNVGLGRGLTAASQDWIIKAIFGRGF